MKFNEKLIELRKQKGLSQEELGNRINVSRQAVSKWESGQVNPEVDKIKEISKVFDVSIDYLVNDEIDNPKQLNIKGKKKNIKKIILKVLLIIIAIYLIVAMYKFIVLLKCSIKANKISDYDKYNIYIGTINKDNIRNELFEDYEDIMCSGEVEIHTSYDEELQKYSSIEYINSKDKVAYTLNYDHEIGKYIYEDLEKLNEDRIDDLYKHTTIRDITKESIPNNIGEILCYALNPKVTVKIKDEYIYIKSDGKLLSMTNDNQHLEVCINKNTGILNSITMENQDRYFTEINYGYNFDDRFIDEDLIDKLKNIENHIKESDDIIKIEEYDKYIEEKY